MKRALICVLLVGPGACRAAGGAHPSRDLTVVLDFKGSYSASAVREMEHEAQEIIKDSGVRLDWRRAEEAAQHSYADLVVVRFQGACLVETDPSLYEETGPPEGPLAFTYTTNGAVQPFSEVACDKVAASIRSAMWGGDFARADVLMGRALGRVVAHELVHMLTRSTDHGHEGVQKPALSGKQLISGCLVLSAADLTRLRVNYIGH